MTCTNLAPIKVFRNTNNTIPITLTDASDGSAIDITGATLYFTVKTKPDLDDTDANALFQKTGSIISGVGGTASFAITTTDTGVSPKTYFYDVRYINGTVNNVLGVGEFVIENVVTNKTS